MRIAFLGTPEFALPSLRSLHDAPHEIALVVSQPDRPRGRGQKLRPSPVRELARKLGLVNTTLEKGQRASVYERLLGLELDAVVVVAFGHILREPLLTGSRHGCLNVHASLLPRWRGPAPIHRAVLAGDERSGVSIMRLDAGVDTGPVYLERATDIGRFETTPQLHDRLAELGALALCETLERIESEGLQPRAQDELGATHAPLLQREEGSVRFDRSALAVHNRIRGLQPWPGVTVLHGERRLRLLRGRPLDVEGAASGAPGEILGIDEEGVQIACNSGVYLLEQLQPAAKGPMAAADYARGANMRVGGRLQTLGEFRELAE